MASSETTIEVPPDAVAGNLTAKEVAASAATLEARARAEKSDDEWLAKHDGAEDEDAPEAAAPVQAKEEHSEAKTSPKETKGQEAGPKGAEYETALNALRRDGIPTKVLEKMDPAEVTEWGLKRAKNQADVDKAYVDLKALKDTKNEPAKTESAPTQSPASVDLKALAKTVADKVGLDEADTPALEQFGQAILDAARKEVSELRQHSETVGRALVKIEVDRARERLQERFPGLKDDGRFKSVIEKAATIDASLSIEERMADAAAIVFFDEAAGSHSVAKREIARDKLNGQFTTESRQTPTRAKTVSEREDDALDAIEAGKGREGARRAYMG